MKESCPENQSEVGGLSSILTQCNAAPPQTRAREAFCMIHGREAMGTAEAQRVFCASFLLVPLQTLPGLFGDGNVSGDLLGATH